MTIEVKFTGETLFAVNLQIGQYLRAFGAPPERTEPEVTAEPKRPRGRPPRASLVEKEPIETPPVEVVAENDADEVEDTEAPPMDAVANEKVKQEVIAQLSDLFTAGKVKTLRHILDTYGHGAKSFPEIDANMFPQIKEALSRGEAA